jgi:hypothetical protein
MREKVIGKRFKKIIKIQRHLKKEKDKRQAKEDKRFLKKADFFLKLKKKKQNKTKMKMKKDKPKEIKEKKKPKKNKN